METDFQDKQIKDKQKLLSLESEIKYLREDLRRNKVSRTQF